MRLQGHKNSIILSNAKYVFVVGFWFAFFLKVRLFQPPVFKFRTYPGQILLSTADIATDRLIHEWGWLPNAVLLSALPLTVPFKILLCNAQCLMFCNNAMSLFYSRSASVVLEKTPVISTGVLWTSAKPLLALNEFGSSEIGFCFFNSFCIVFPSHHTNYLYYHF